MLYTVGHSNVPQEALLDQLLAAEIKLLVDIRRYPMSRRNPQFNRDALAAALREHDIDYRHFESLGGRRDASLDSINHALPDGLRGFADYMATSQFDFAVEELIVLAEELPTAVMCAETNPANCHRSLLSDALTARGIDVVHIVKGVQRPHQLSPRARVEGTNVTYPTLL